MPSYFSNNYTITDHRTNVTINVIAVGTKITYKIKTPNIIDVDFVLALDSSGNFGMGGDEDREKAVIYAVPRFLEELDNLYPDKNIKVSVISWDDNIDFAYAGFENTDPFKASLVPIHKASYDVRNLSNYYICDENEYSNLSIPISASLDIFKNNPPAKYKRTLRFIILVTGKGIFKNCSDELTRELYSNGYELYVIGLDILNPDSKIFEQLRTLGGIGNYHSLLSIGDDLEETLRRIFTEIRINDPMSPVLGDVTITQTLDGYLDPISVKVNGTEIGFNKIINSDGTKIIKIRLPKGLIENSDTNVIIDTKININKLPELVLENGFSPIISTVGSPFKGISPSHIEYTWQNGEKIIIELPKPFIPPLDNN